jgi:hypothetical protein
VAVVGLEPPEDKRGRGERTRKQENGRAESVPRYTQSKSWHQNVRKIDLWQRKLRRKISPPRARFNDRLELPSWPGKDGAALTLG